MQDYKKTIEIPVAVLQQILRELKVAEVLFDSEETYLNYHNHQDKETKDFMLDSVSNYQEHKKQDKKLADVLRDMLIQEFVKSKEQS